MSPTAPADEASDADAEAASSAASPPPPPPRLPEDAVSGQRSESDAASDVKAEESDDDWLPPPAIDHGKDQHAADGNDDHDGDDGLLPPGVDDAPGEQVALPAGASMAASIAHRDERTMITEEGEVVSLHDPVKTVGDGDEQVELHQLTPEERAARRFRKNLIVWTVGILILVATMYFMR